MSKFKAGGTLTLEKQTMKGKVFTTVKIKEVLKIKENMYINDGLPCEKFIYRCEITATKGYEYFKGEIHLAYDYKTKQMVPMKKDFNDPNIWVNDKSSNMGIVPYSIISPKSFKF